MISRVSVFPDVPDLGIRCPLRPGKLGLIETMEKTAINKNTCHQAKKMADASQHQTRSQKRPRVWLVDEKLSDRQEYEDACIAPQDIWCMIMPLSVDKKTMVKTEPGEDSTQEKSD